MSQLQQHDQVGVSALNRGRFHRPMDPAPNVPGILSACRDSYLDHFFYWPNEIEYLNEGLAVKLTPCPRCFRSPA